jgi:cysteine-rich repeat protein
MRCVPSTCGDGIIDAEEGCDDGNDIQTDGCLNLCERARCGDGHRGPGEGCDDGNADPDDACDNCRPATCANGTVDEGEACDDGNDDPSDACLNNCAPATCGDGIIWQDQERCDDGNTWLDNCSYGLASCQVCGPDCTLVPGTANRCGDGIINGPESCDPFEPEGGIFCTDFCEPFSCGSDYDLEIIEGWRVCIAKELSAELGLHYDTSVGISPSWHASCRLRGSPMSSA